MWVVDWDDAKIYAYDLNTKSRDASRDLDTLSAAGNTTPLGLWSDGITMWVVDWDDAKIYAYNLTTKAPDPSRDFDTLRAAGNTSPKTLWSDRTTLWVVDAFSPFRAKIYAYDLTTRARDASKDFDRLYTAENYNPQPQGLWSDGITMWVADWIDDKIYAYDLTTMAPDASRDFDTLIAAGNTNPRGLWSDGNTMWVADGRDAKIYAHSSLCPPDDATGTIEPVGREVVVSVYPNPSGGALHVELPFGEFYKISVLTLAGQAVLGERQVGGGSRTLDLSSLARSVYVLVVEASGGERTTRLRLILE